MPRVDMIILRVAVRYYRVSFNASNNAVKRRLFIYLNSRRRLDSYVRSRDILRVEGSTRADLVSPERVPVLAIGDFTSESTARVNYYDTDTVRCLSSRLS